MVRGNNGTHGKSTYQCGMTYGLIDTSTQSEICVLRFCRTLIPGRDQGMDKNLGGSCGAKQCLSNADAFSLAMALRFICDDAR